MHLLSFRLVYLKGCIMSTVKSAYYNEIDPFCCRWLRGLQRDGLITDGEVDGRSIAEVQPEDVAGFRRVHFFAGSSGWDHALNLAGWGDREVWTGSVPCQPFSAAGKGLGEKDERHLWPEFRRLIDECRPPVIFGEQVASSEVIGTQLEASFVVAVQYGDYARANKLAKRLTQSHGFHYWARWVDRVHGDLEKLDYSFRFKILGAHSVGAPHIRQRLFWVADTGCNGHQGAESASGPSPRMRQRPPKHGVADRLGITDSQGPQQGHESTEADRYGDSAIATGPWADSRPILCRDGKTRRIPSVRSEIQPLASGIPRAMAPLLARLSELGVDTKTAKAIIRDARRHRVGCLRGSGNAIVPLIASEFIRAYMETRLNSP